jgi:hypothetical protein
MQRQVSRKEFWSLYVRNLSVSCHQRRVKGQAGFWLTFATLFYIRSYIKTRAARGVVWVFVRYVRAVFFADKDTKDTVLAGLTVSFVSLAADRSHDSGVRRPLGKFGDIWSATRHSLQRSKISADAIVLGDASFGGLTFSPLHQICSLVKKVFADPV